MAMGDSTTHIRSEDVVFDTTQRGRQIPSVANYLFVCKEKEGTWFACRTASCRATLIRHDDLGGVHYVLVRQHNHPPRDEAIKHITHKNNLRHLSQSKHGRLLTTRCLASSARLETDTTRRLRTDMRFVRRVRQNKCWPRVPGDIVFDDATMSSVLFHTEDNGVIVFGESQMVGNASSNRSSALARSCRRSKSTASNSSSGSPSGGPDM